MERLALARERQTLVTSAQFVLLRTIFLKQEKDPKKKTRNVKILQHFSEERRREG
jgi:hypothetical protein